MRWYFLHPSLCSKAGSLGMRDSFSTNELLRLWPRFHNYHTRRRISLRGTRKLSLSLSIFSSATSNFPRFCWPWLSDGSSHINHTFFLRSIGTKSAETQTELFFTRQLTRQRATSNRRPLPFFDPPPSTHQRCRRRPTSTTLDDG